MVDIPSGLGEGLSSAIVRILKEYDKALPIEFLAALMRRRPHEIEQELETLEKRGAVKREGDRVRLQA